MKEFETWIEAQLPKQWPSSVIAISFNLYESVSSFQIEMIGSSKYNEQNPDWACDEVWVPNVRLCNLPIAREVGWEDCLAQMKVAVQDYILNSEKLNLFKSLEGIGIGFVGGDLEHIQVP